MIARLLGLVTGRAWILPAIALAIIGVQQIALMSSRTQIAQQKALHAEHLAADATAEAKAQAEARDAEAASAAAMAQIDQTHQEELRRVDQTIAALRADIDAGRVRLRSRFTCPAHDVPKAGTGPGSGDGGSGLRASDAQFLVRLADACDAQVRAAQNIIRNDRGKP